MNHPAGFILFALLAATIMTHAQERSLDEILKMSDDTTKVSELVDASYKVSDTNISLADSLVVFRIKSVISSDWHALIIIALFILTERKIIKTL